MGLSEFGVAIVGCGTVGNATAKLLLSEEERLFEKTGCRIKLKALVAVNYERARKAGLDESLFNEDFQSVLSNPAIHLVVETIGGLTTATTIIKKALKAGKHVVTANKALLAHHGSELFTLARTQKVSIGFEASCCGGIPIIRALTDGLLANDIDALYGIVNGTTNFILTEMVENEKSYTQALQDARTAGLVEADSTLDISGIDAAHKLTLMASLAFRQSVPLESIPVEGIDNLNLLDVATGRELGYVLKLLVLAKKTEAGLELAVQPAFLLKENPLSRVSGPFNAVSIYGHAVGHTMYYGRGAGGSATSSAVVSDILSIMLGTWPKLFDSLTIWPDLGKPAELAESGDAVHRYYLRFRTRERMGVVADIAAALASHKISIKSFIQKESPKQDDPIPTVVTTHRAREKDVCKAVKAILALPSVDEEAVKIRIIDEHEEFSGESS